MEGVRGLFLKEGSTIKDIENKFYWRLFLIILFGIYFVLFILICINYLVDGLIL